MRSSTCRCCWHAWNGCRQRRWPVRRRHPCNGSRRTGRSWRRSTTGSTASTDSSIATLQGVPVPQEVWTTGLVTGYTVEVGKTLANVAAKLAADINSGLVGTTTVAAARGATLVIVSSSAFSPVYAVTPVNGATVSSAITTNTVTVGGTPAAGETVHSDDRPGWGVLLYGRC